MGEVVVRPMRLKDVDAVAAIEAATFAHPWSRESFRQEKTRNAAARYLVAEEDGEIVGYAGAWVIIDESHNNIVKLPKGRLAVINGLDGYIVAEKDNVLLICKKEDSSDLIRKYITDVQISKGDEFI